MTLAANHRSAPHVWKADPVSDSDVAMDLRAAGGGPSTWCSLADRLAARRWIEDLHCRNAPRIACLQDRSSRVRAENSITLAQGRHAALISLFPAVKAYAAGWPVASVGATVLFGQRLDSDDDLLAAARAAPAGGYLYVGAWPTDGDSVTDDAIMDALSILAAQRGDGQAAVVDDESAPAIDHMASRIVSAEREIDLATTDLDRFMADPTVSRTKSMDPGVFLWTYRVSYPDDGREPCTVSLDPRRLRIAAMLMVPALSP